MYPIAINMEGRECLFIGGGPVSERRIKGLLDEGAIIRVLSPRVTPQIEAWHREGRITWDATLYERGSLGTPFLVFLCTNVQAVQEVAYEEAKEKGLLVNRSDDKDACDFTMPAQVRLGMLHIALWTGKGSPRLSRLVRAHMEKTYGPLEEVVHDLESMRQEVQRRCPNSTDRQRFWETHLTETEIQKILDGHWEAVKERLHHEICSIRV